MTQRSRKAYGILLILLSIVVWVSLCTSIYLIFPPDLPPWILLPYFVAAGIGWMLPAMPIIRWMSRQDP